MWQWRQGADERVVGVDRYVFFFFNIIFNLINEILDTFKLLTTTTTLTTTTLRVLPRPPSFPSPLPPRGRGWPRLQPGTMRKKAQMTVYTSFGPRCAR